MKYKKEWKVELCWERFMTYSSSRYYYWRINPCELNIFQRIFCNPWIRLKRECLDNWNPIFGPEYYKDISNINTYGDILKFREREWKKIQEKRNQYIEAGAVFPDDYD